MIVLYQFPISPFCDKIRRVLHFKKVPYRVHDVPLLQSMTLLPRVNPIGKVPCIDDGGRVVADSTDIARYLEERYPAPALVPSSPRERALCHMLEDWADESLYFYEVRMRLTIPHNARRTIGWLTLAEPRPIQMAAQLIVPRITKDIAAKQGIGRKPVAMVIEEARRHVEALSDFLGEGSFLVGDSLSLADISVFAQMFCIRGTDEGGELVEARPAVARWMDRVDAATAGAPSA